MARLARVVAPGLPHHVTQRGNRRQKTFFCEKDYVAYIRLMKEWCTRCHVDIWAYCLMPNHVHLIAVPESEDGLRLAIGEAHRRYTRRVNFREGWRGHLWQGRFASFVMDQPHLLSAARYIEMNPVMAGLVSRPQDWRWSSAAAHIAGQNDTLVKANPLTQLVSTGWQAFLQLPVDDESLTLLRRHEKTGRPLGDKTFVENLENMLGRILTAQKPGRKSNKLG